MKAQLVQLEHFTCQQSESLQFIPAEILPVALGEPVDKERKLALPEQYDRTEPARPALTLAGNALFDDSSSEISIDQTPPGSADSVAQGRIIHSLTVSKAGEHLRLECAQSQTSRRPLIMITIAPSVRVVKA